MSKSASFAERATLKLSNGLTRDPQVFAKQILTLHQSKPKLHLTKEELKAHVMKAEKPAYIFGRSNYVSGRNWFGGLPLLPAGQPWPRTCLYQQPMHFWAQIDCSTLEGKHDLPRKGMLLFFFDLDAHGATRPDSGLGKVLFLKEREIPKIERQPPSDLPLFSHYPGEQQSSFSSKNQNAKFAAEPHAYASYDVRDVALNWDRLVMENEFDACELASEFTRANRHATIATKAPETNQKHALLGQEEALTAPKRDDDVRLMCLDSDVEMDWQFGDCGVVEFWISPDDLRARRFDLAYAMTS